MTVDAVAMVRQVLMDRMTRHRETLDQAASSLRPVLNNPDALEAAQSEIRADIAQNDLLDSPRGVADRNLAFNAQLGPWYSGPEPGDMYWPSLKERLLAGPMCDVVSEIDRASTKVVAQLANPRIFGLKKLGLVLGYVQSGKTANFTAVMSKAADRGVGLFIVLSGIHNNLRQQTQARIAKDLSLASGRWVSLTTDDADFVNDTRHSAASQLRPDRPVVIVVKKNQRRLQNLHDWLKEAPAEVLRRTPVLLLDDEADQATPNSASARQARTAINELVRGIWGLIPTGTYVGYTATPFANIFMDPNDDEDLYPSNFIIDLPRPGAYFGAEKLFGREPVSDEDEPESGLDMVRDVPDVDAAALRPPSDKDQRDTWDVDLPDSLKAAVRWFIVATSIRRARGQRDHSSMLVHTTHYARPHFAMRRKIAGFVRYVEESWTEGEQGDLRSSFETEIDRAAEERHGPRPDWHEVKRHVGDVLHDLRVIVDNGTSDDRLDYGRIDAKGQPLQEVVIAVGGGTLSRGLTLEGLVVSYFTRTSNTYDTLLQMGRWFGYRGGYEDLPRLWIQRSLAEEYRFLALVEAEIRQDILDMERQQITPRELGVRVRGHPGRLSIVARNKMGAARLVRVSYAGERLQTFIFDLNREVARRNIENTRNFLRVCMRSSELVTSKSPPRWRIRDVRAETVARFLDGHSIHESQKAMSVEYMTGWIREVAPDSLWNVTVLGPGRATVRSDGTPVDLGELDLGLGSPVPGTNRAPLSSSTPGTANIKALLTHADWFADMEPAELAKLGNDALRYPREVRRALAAGRGEILVYVVSKDSQPLTKASELSRQPMAADVHLVGVGVVFPETAGEYSDATYYGVTPDWRPEFEPDDELPPDTEGDAQVLVGDGVAEEGA